jgi:cyclophilin family peptidyl-prolyl cis-trans isomerase
MSKKKRNRKIQSSKPKTSNPKTSGPKIRTYLIIAAALMAVVFLAIGISSVLGTPEESNNNAGQPADQLTGPEALSATKQVTVSTAEGDIVIEVYPEAMPITVANFEKLVKQEFYDGVSFHRVEDWVIQGGCPVGNGSGGPGWTIKLETNPGLNNRRGMVAMARSAAPDSAGSQFYILKQDASWLDGEYAVFGKVIQGMEIVDRMEIGTRMNKVTIDSL